MDQSKTPAYRNILSQTVAISKRLEKDQTGKEHNASHQFKKNKIHTPIFQCQMQRDEGITERSVLKLTKQWTKKSEILKDGFIIASILSAKMPQSATWRKPCIWNLTSSLT